ncbi:MAG: hypothetical protein QXI16_03415 [Sulfolobaceae archaeon]
MWVYTKNDYEIIWGGEKYALVANKINEIDNDVANAYFFTPMYETMSDDDLKLAQKVVLQRWQALYPNLDITIDFLFNEFIVSKREDEVKALLKKS